MTAIMRLATLTTLVLALAGITLAQVKIDNGIADPEVVVAPPPEQTQQLCRVEGPPLDLMLVVDSSGSLRNEFHRQISTVLLALKHLAIGPESTRVSLIQYSARAVSRFDFNTYTNRDDIENHVKRLTTTGATTKTGEGLKLAYDHWSVERGMRPNERKVRRILFLLSDGRSTDYPDDVNWGAKLREDKGIEFYSYGLGDYIDWRVLREVTTGSSQKGYNRVVNNANFTMLQTWFEPFKGIEVCDEVPVCIPGAHRPLDLMFVLDTSTSVSSEFDPMGAVDESLNFIRRTLNTVNVHPQATRVAMISYAGHPRIEFAFNSPKSRNNSAIMNYLQEFRATAGITKTSDALKEAAKLFDPVHGARGSDVKKLLIIITDGYSTGSPAVFARRLVELKQVDIFAIALNIGGRPANLNELRELIVEDASRIFPVQQRIFIKNQNLVTFESALLNYTDSSCPGLNLTADEGVKQVRMPYETKCTPQGMKVILRTRNEFTGTMYAVGYADAPGCSLTGTNKKESSMVFAEGSCGMASTPGDTELQTKYSIRIAIRFHPLVDTAADDYFDASCIADKPFDKKPASDDGLLRLVKDASNIRCSYNIVPTTTERQCEILDADVGLTVSHEWSCKGLNQDQFMLVHDCTADADTEANMHLSLLTEHGCEVDRYLMTTPEYAIKQRPNFVSVRSYIFKFPTDTIVRFRCMISICDTSSPQTCQYAFNAISPAGETIIRNIPSECLNHPEGSVPKTIASANLPNYENPQKKPGYMATFGVEARRVNVFQKANLASEGERKYCTIERRQRLLSL